MHQNIIAILAVRNERPYLQACITHLLNNGVQVFVLDNGSTDGSLEVLKDQESCPGFRGWEAFPYPGYFDLEGLLKRKEALRWELRANWFIHQDADEFLFTDRAGERLADGMARIQALGYDSVNFREFIFLPKPGASNDNTFKPENYPHYYFFHPSPMYLVRAYSKDVKGTNIEQGGHHPPLHTLNPYPGAFQKRHYLAFSREQFYRKYALRTFKKENIEKGWHFDRWVLGHQQPDFPDTQKLEKDGQAEILKPGRYFRTHFWQWKPDEPRGIPILEEENKEPLKKREKRLLDQLQQHWNAYGLHDPLWKNMEHEKESKRLEAFWESGFKEIAAVMAYRERLPVLQTKARALDFGCGAGRLSQALAAYFDRVDGVDIAPSLIERAKRRLPAGASVHYHTWKEAQLDLFSDNTFDLIYSNITLQYLPPELIRRYLQELIRVLRPGGLLLFQLPAAWKSRSAEGRWSWKASLLKKLYHSGGYYLFRKLLFARDPLAEWFFLSKAEVAEEVDASQGFVLDYSPDQSAGPWMESYRYAVSK